MRLIAERYKTFEVDVTQLPVYAEYEGDYILEVDKSGCAKSCVCNYCITEDQYSRYRSNTLRIKERPRWQRLTSEMLKELRLDFNATVTNTSTSSVNHSIAANRNESSKNEHAKLVDNTGNSSETSARQFHDKQQRDVMNAKGWNPKGNTTKARPSSSNFGQFFHLEKYDPKFTQSLILVGEAIFNALFDTGTEKLIQEL